MTEHDTMRRIAAARSVQSQNAMSEDERRDLCAAIVATAPADASGELIQLTGGAGRQGSGSSLPQSSRRHRSRYASVLVGTAIAAGLVAAGVFGLGPSSSTPNAAALDLVGRLNGQQVVPLGGGQPAPNLGWSTVWVLGEKPTKTWVFKPGPTLSQRGGRGAAYRLLTPSDPAAFVNRVGGSFGVTGTPISHGGHFPQWTIGATTGPQVSYAVQGSMPLFSYARSTCELNAIGLSNVWGEPYPGCPRPPHHPQGAEEVQVKDILTHSLMDKIAAGWVRRWGLRYGIAQPGPVSSGVNSIYFFPKSTNPIYRLCGHACIYERALYDVTIHGVPNGQNVGFTFDQRGTVLAAGGPAFSVGTATTYPLLSPSAAVAVLDGTHPTQGFALDEGPMPLTECKAHRCHLVRCKAKRCRVRLLPPYPMGHGTLNAVTLTTNIYVLRDGSLITLPTYSYGGATYQTGTGRSAPLQVLLYELAVVPSAVHYSAPASG